MCRIKKNPTNSKNLCEFLDWIKERERGSECDMRFYILTQLGVLCRKVVQIDVNKTVPPLSPRAKYDHNNDNNNDNNNQNRLMHSHTHTRW